MSTVITHKTFPNDKKYEMELAGRPFSIEVGKYAELANAAAMVKYGETTVMVAVTASPRPRDGVDFFPLSVDFEEKLYAVGRIPGSFMRREGRPSLPAVLASRLIDRPMRPLFPSDLRNDVLHHLHRHEPGPRLLPRGHRYDRRLRHGRHLRHSLERPHRLLRGGLCGRPDRHQPHP